MSAVHGLGGVELRAGFPRVAASLSATDLDGLRTEAQRLVAAGADVAEWRLDHLLAARPTDALEHVPGLLALLREQLADVPLLVTVRSSSEGGAVELSEVDYARALRAVLAAGIADGVDIEIARHHAWRELTPRAQSIGCSVVGSHHDLTATPPADRIIELLGAMAAAGADVAKVAVTARDADDVLELLAATRSAARDLTVPVVTMAMGEVGRVSRLCGHVFGSVLTFGALGTPSAPGQTSVADLHHVLGLLPAGP